MMSFIVVALLMSMLLSANGSNEVFNHCIRSSPNPGLVNCIGQQTISSLHYLDKTDNYSIDSGFELIRTDFERQRSMNDFFIEDPTDFRWVKHFL